MFFIVQEGAYLVGVLFFHVVNVHMAYYLGKLFPSMKRKQHAHLRLYNGRWNHKAGETRIELQLIIHLKEHLVLGKGTICYAATGANISITVHGVTQISTVSIILFETLPGGKEKLGIVHLNYTGKALLWNLIHKGKSDLLPAVCKLQKV